MKKVVLDKYTIINFSDNDTLNMHLRLLGVTESASNREILRNMGTELRLFFGKDDIKHAQLQQYLNYASNFIRLNQ